MYLDVNVFVILGSGVCILMMISHCYKLATLTVFIVISVIFKNRLNI